MKQFELCVIRYDTEGKAKSVDRIESDNLVDLLSQFGAFCVMIIGKMKVGNETLYTDHEPTLTLTKEECQAFDSCPFSKNFASENNYPGYNETLRKVCDFARK
jgi:hypothetical protein